MKKIPSYTKILTLGSAYTENALVGDVVIQEKVDGSQFRFGIDEDGNLVLGSKSVSLHTEAPDNMFKLGVDYIVSLGDELLGLKPDTYFYAEYLQKPKHNTLKYTTIPQNHIVLFDGISQGKFMDRKELVTFAKLFEIDIIPELYRGNTTVDQIKELVETESYLGGEKMEGVVIKNYEQTILLGGKVLPLFTKHVRESFKERHNTEWKIKKPKGTIDDFIQGFRTEARWLKAVQYLRDKQELENQPRDIGKLIKRVQKDIIEEEKENIKNELYKKVIKEIKRVSTQGLPEWYKEQLLGNLKGENK